ncbi:MAG: hypothetical protein LBC97_04205 [Bifidobacteriaceae bacterium]|jgi:phage I-like protein|nr:hypothetical protein [Bifidobacteriaceae bacterium]
MTTTTPFHQAIRTAAAILADKWGTPLDGSPDEVHIWTIIEAYAHHMVRTTIEQMDPAAIDWQAVAAATGHPDAEHVKAAYGCDKPPF